jgi:hypothetical protein
MDLSEVTGKRAWMDIAIAVTVMLSSHAATPSLARLIDTAPLK